MPEERQQTRRYHPFDEGETSGHKREGIDQPSVILEVENHTTGNTALTGFNSISEADELLQAKGFKRMMDGEAWWAGLDSDGNEVSVTLPMVMPPGGLLEVSQPEERRE